MPRALPTDPVTSKNVSASRAEEVLSELLAARKGWKTNAFGVWTHKKTGLCIKAIAGSTPFHVGRENGAGSTALGTRSALLLLLDQAGA